MEKVQYKLNVPSGLYEQVRAIGETDHMTISGVIIRSIMLFVKIWHWGRDGRHVYVEDENGEMERILLV